MQQAPRLRLVEITSSLLVAYLSIVPACDGTPKAEPAVEDASKAEVKPKKPSASERQAGLTMKARAQYEAGKVEAAIATYAKAEEIGPLIPKFADGYAAALKVNGDALVDGGKNVSRGIVNYVKAITLAPGYKGLVDALVQAAKKHDATKGVYSEDIVAACKDEYGMEFGAQGKPALAEFYKRNAERLMKEPWASVRVTKNLDLAATLAPNLPGLAGSQERAKEKVLREYAEALKVQEHYDKLWAEDPSRDVIEVVAKRRKMTRDEVTAAIELVAAAKEAQAKQAGR